MAASGSGRGDVRRCAAATDTSKREVRQIVSFCPVYQLDSVTLRLESEMDRDGTLNGDGQINGHSSDPGFSALSRPGGVFFYFLGLALPCPHPSHTHLSTDPSPLQRSY